MNKSLQRREEGRGRETGGKKKKKKKTKKRDRLRVRKKRAEKRVSVVPRSPSTCGGGMEKFCENGKNQTNGGVLGGGIAIQVADDSKRGGFSQRGNKKGAAKKEIYNKQVQAKNVGHREGRGRKIKRASSRLPNPKKTKRVKRGICRK